MALAMAAPWWLPPGWTLARGVVALGATLAAGRLVELWRDPRPRTAAQRVWHAFGIVDTRRVRRLTRGGRLRARLPRMAIFGILFALGLYLVGSVGPSLHAGGAAAAYGVRWLGAALGMASLAELLFVAPDLVYAALGLDAGPLHSAPERSRSLAEFWGLRWNRVIGMWLAEQCFRPVARRGHPRLAQLAAFAASGALHFYFTWVALGAFWAAVMASYFLVQGGLVLLESALDIRRWPHPAARAWTWAAVLLPAPLVLEPSMRVCGLLP